MRRIVDPYFKYLSLSSSGKPNFVVKPEDISVVSSDRNNVRLECTVAGDPQPSIRWTKDGKPLEGSPKLKINSNGRTGMSSIVEINDVSSNDQGEYVCEASNEVGTVTAPAKVSIECKFSAAKSS